MIENQEQGKNSNSSELTNTTAEHKLIDAALVAGMTTEEVTEKLNSELAAANAQRNALETSEENIQLLMGILKNQGQSLDEIIPV